jgi:putative mRNA 3-end processing factor
VIVTHGYESVMVRWLAEQGLEAGAFSTEYGDDQEAREEARAAADERSPEPEPGA